MKLVPYDKANVAYKLCKNQRVIDEFIRSGLDCVKIENYTQSTPYICRHSLANAIRRMGLQSTVYACTYKKEVFLIRIDNE